MSQAHAEMDPASVRKKVTDIMEQLTLSERKVASILLADYPYAGLMTIQEFAKKAHVSPPSVTRFVSKIGCAGYHEFQRHLIGELKQRELSPIELKLTEEASKGAHFLTDYTQRLMRLMKFMAENIPPQHFEAICALLADPGRNVFIIGGRVTDGVARVYHIPQDQEQWPEFILKMRKQDVLVVFDLRRYQPSLARLAREAAGPRQCTVIAITDKWLSPVAIHASHIFALPIEMVTAWDTRVCLLTLTEAMIVRIAEANWMATRKRIECWDSIRHNLNAPDASGGKI